MLSGDRTVDLAGLLYVAPGGSITGPGARLTVNAEGFLLRGGTDSLGRLASAFNRQKSFAGDLELSMASRLAPVFVPAIITPWAATRFRGEVVTW